MPEDKLILKQFKEGNAEAFDAIYYKYSVKLYHFALGLVKDETIAQDLVQEVFVNLWEKKDQVDPSLNFDNYIFTIAYNSIRKFFRKKSVETKFINKLLKDSPEIVESVEGAAIYSELLEIANKAIDKLPPKRKEVYKLSRQEGMKVKEIAQQTEYFSPHCGEPPGESFELPEGRIVPDSTSYTFVLLPLHILGTLRFK